MKSASRGRPLTDQGAPWEHLYARYVPAESRALSLTFARLFCRKYAIFRIDILAKSPSVWRFGDQAGDLAFGPDDRAHARSAGNTCHAPANHFRALATTVR